MILVTGGAGVVGSRLVRRLCDKGYQVRVLTLPNDPAIANLEGLPCEIFEADVTDSISLAGVCAGVDTVFHLAAIIITNNDENYWRINYQGTKNMVETALESGVKHFILVSSAAVHDPSSSEYARSKKDAEELLLQQKGLQPTITRPSLVYEKGGGQEFMLFWESLKKWPVIPFIGKGGGMKNPVYAEDLITALAAIPYNRNSFGKIYNLTGGGALTMLELTRLLLRHQGRRKVIVHLPLSLCYLLALIFEKIMKKPLLTRYGISRIEADANEDNSEARRDLGYVPITFEEGLQRCYPVSPE
ncbi:MAG: NAD-dependent epimerase/dehydratase family protein [Proteobacteria bacterium]|nr:NAD-dependent epimerase/dehydratase family protein [Pseudomonadota bacterium]MBU1420614.1 NAD-dependent epimerase/dehydratase family protein [Pseudomonadota bacterium]MBU1456617.1 NAD-dependent epimerase/dehydratase family protein [Pseudomonadota bacterium]